MHTVTLIIDKRKELSTKYKKLLKDKYNDCIVTKSLISAMKTIQDFEPDLIIISDSIDSDLSDYCKKIRALTYDTRPIIVAISKSDDIVDKVEVLKNGADDYISEPVNSDEFAMRMKAHLRREYESNLDSKKSIPNRNYSMRALKRMICTKDNRSALLVSIDNFSNYRENYTELASDKLIQTYWAIIKSAIEEDDYLGEIKDDEFLVIVDSEKAEAIANYLIYAFETVSSKFYSIDDNKRGYMMMKGDDKAGRRSGFVHTTIGIVGNENSMYKDGTQLFNALLRINRMAKISTKSNYLIERPQLVGETVVQDFTNNKIVVVEKDEALSILLKTILELQGYEVEVVQDYDFSCLQSSPALMILDAGSMETLSGLDFCKKIKEDERYASVQIIVTSVVHDKEMVLDCGADLYLPKPYEISALIKWVDVLLRE